LRKDFQSASRHKANYRKDILTILIDPPVLKASAKAIKITGGNLIRLLEENQPQ
jgi:hypothetical protein